MAVWKDTADYEYEDRSVNHGLQVKSVPNVPRTIKVKLASGKIMELERPKIIRTSRLDSLTLNRDVVRAFGRLEARNRALAGDSQQLKLDL